ncbi:hypothetical protein ABPG73_005950 [Tetrahymena malaccensis]
MMNQISIKPRNLEQLILKFKKIPAQCIDQIHLGSNFYDEVNYQVIGDAIPKCVNLTSFIMDSFIYDIKYIKLILEILQNCTNLTSLNLGLYANDEISLEILGKAFEKLLNLSSLSLKLQNPQNILYQCGIGFSKCKKLTSLNLDLSHTNFKEQSIQFFIRELEECENLISLSLNLKNIKITNVADYLILSLKKCINLHSLNLNFSENQMTDYHFCKFAKGLSGFVKLTSFKLQIMDDIDKQHLKSLKNVLTTYLPCRNRNSASGSYLIDSLNNCINLTSLDLSLFFYSCDTTVRNLGDLISNSINLISLNLDLFQCYLSDNSIMNIVKGLQNCVNLKSLNLELSDNEIRDDGIKFLGESISKCINLTQLILNLNDNNISNEGARYLGDQISKCIKLHSLSLNYNDAIHLCESFLKYTNLITLSLQLYITDLNSEYLGEALSKCAKLKNINLNISSAKISVKAKQDLTKKISKCVQLTTLNLTLKENKIQYNKKMIYFLQKSKRLINIF